MAETQALATKFNVAPALGVPFRTVVATGATPTIAAYFDATQYPLDALFFELKVVAAYDDGSKMATYWRQAAFRADSAGVLTQVGSTRTVVTDNEDTAGMDVSIAVGTPTASGSGTGLTNTQIQVTVTGVAATAINWLFDTTIRHAPFSQ